MFERFDPQARLVLDDAQAAARELQCPFVGTEHLLLAISRTTGPATDVLTEYGINTSLVRDAIISIMSGGHPRTREPDELLESLGIDIGEVRRRVEAAFGPEAVQRAALATRPRRRRRWPVVQRFWPGCDQGTPCTSALLGHRSYGFAPRCKRVLELATRSSSPAPPSALHLLAGILEEGEGLACQILVGGNVDLEAMARSVRARLA